MIRKKIILFGVFLTVIGQLSACSNILNYNQSVKANKHNKKEPLSIDVEQMTKTPHDSTSR